MNYNLILHRDPSARAELADAYTRLFNGTGGLTDAQVVLSDLMAVSGYFNICPEGESLERHEGKRSVGGRIFSMITMADYEREALYQAARRSSIIDQIGGEI